MSVSLSVSGTQIGQQGTARAARVGISSPAKAALPTIPTRPDCHATFPACCIHYTNIRVCPKRFPVVSEKGTRGEVWRLLVETTVMVEPFSVTSILCPIESLLYLPIVDQLGSNVAFVVQLAGNDPRSDSDLFRKINHLLPLGKPW